MGKLKTLIIDDEEDARITLRALLDMYCPNVEIIAEADSVESGITQITAHQPDLVFLDIRLSPGSGFDVLHALAPINFRIIFVTAYDEYAIRAIRFSALDYLTKPVDIDELEDAVKRAGEKEEKHSLQLEVFRDTMSARFGRMVLPTLEGFIVIQLADLVRCEADRNYTHVYLKDGRKLTASRSLKSYDELLSPNGFHRIHQSHIVNLAEVREYKRRKKGGIALLSNGDELPVSDQRKDGFLAKFLG
ncbi:MAG: LytR/AlgR family response regulator transcription factor [Bacteroidia bacterium]